MAFYLPLIAVLLAGGGPAKLAPSELVAIVTVLLVVWVATRYGPALSRLATHKSDEIVLLTTFGTVLVVAGLAERVHVSSAMEHFWWASRHPGRVAEQSHRLLAPFRDFFAALFFFFFGLQIDPGTLPNALPLAAALAAVTALTKALTGYWAAGRHHLDRRGGVRAGMALVARGEFSIVIAGLGTGLEPQLGPLSAAYVLLLAILGPLLVRATR
jgi:CPA2 family monovalent cation:H+ antiporter-2